MGRVLTNNLGLAYSIESALGTAGTSWQYVEPNEVGRFGTNISKVARNPISKNRQRRKGTVTDLDSAVEYQADWTMSAFEDFVEGFCFATAINADMDIASTAAETTTDTYTVAALTAAQSAKLEFSTGEYATLIYARGFTNSGNNGLKSVDADIATSATAISVAENLVDEASPPANARVELAGLRSLAAAADWTWDWDGTEKTGTLTSAADITDFSQFGLTVGQFIHIGSPDGSGGVTNAFENAAANDMYGYARIKTLGTGTIVCDKVDAALQFDDAVAPTTAVDIMFGKFIRNVDVDDTDYLERSFQFEAEWENLGSAGASEFEYAKGNYCNEVAFQLPLADKATVSFGFIGTDTESPVASGSRKSGASTALNPLMTDALNTSADIARLRVTETDETSLTTDFKSLTITIGNNVSPEKVLGTLGASYMNTGNFMVDIEAELLFTNGDVVDRIRNNTTVTMDFIVKNGDGGVAVDVPSLTLGDGTRNLPVNESVTIQTTSEAHEDETLGTSIGISTFPYLP